MKIGQNVCLEISDKIENGLCQDKTRSLGQIFDKPSAEVRGKNNLERKVASTGDRTHNHQVTSPTCSPLSHPGGAGVCGRVSQSHID